MEKYFLSNEIFGDLVIRDVLINYDYPRVFICENKIGAKYLFSESDFDDDYNEWIVVALSNGKYYQLITSQVYLRTSLISSEDGKYYLVKRTYSTDELYSKKSDLPFYNKVPKENTYVGVVSSKEIDSHNILNESMKIGSPLIDVVLFPNNHEVQDIDSSLLEETCGNFRKLFGVLNTRKVVRVSTVQGSFVVRFNLNDPTNLFTVSDGEKVINIVHSVFSNNNPVDIYRELSCSSDAFDKYKNVLDTLKKINNDVNIISSSPSDTSPKIQVVDKKFVTSSINNIKEFFKEIKSDIEVEGNLFAFDKKHKKFSFRTNKDEEISGTYIDEAYPEGFEYTIDKKYKCTIEKIVKESDDNSKTKEGPSKYILKKAVLIS